MLFGKLHWKLDQGNWKTKHAKHIFMGNHDSSSLLWSYYVLWILKPVLLLPIRQVNFLERTQSQGFTPDTPPLVDTSVCNKQGRGYLKWNPVLLKKFLSKKHLDTSASNFFFQLSTAIHVNTGIVRKMQGIYFTPPKRFSQSSWIKLKIIFVSKCYRKLNNVIFKRLKICKTAEVFFLTPKVKNYEAEWWRSLTHKIFRFICKNKKASYKSGQHYFCSPAESVTFVRTSQLTFQSWTQFWNVQFRAFSPWTLKISGFPWIARSSLTYCDVEVSVSVAPTKPDLLGRSQGNDALSILRKVDFFFVMFYFSEIWHSYRFPVINNLFTFHVLLTEVLHLKIVPRSFEKQISFTILAFFWIEDFVKGRK